MKRFPARLIALAPEERWTLSWLADESLAVAAAGLRDTRCATRLRETAGTVEAVARIVEASESGMLDVGDPMVRTWLSARRDVLLAREAGDDHDSLALIARLLSDALDVAAAA